MYAGCGGAEQGVDQQAAEVVLVGGSVMTMDAERPRAEALAIRGGRIVAVGRDRDVLPSRDARSDRYSKGIVSEGEE